MHTLSEIASELPRMYSEAKRANNPKTFDQIIKKLFIDHGSKFDYPNFDIFKRVVLKVYNNKKKNPAQTEVFVKKLIPDEEFFFSTKIKEEEINENSGAVFTEYQIRTLGLNPDSY